MSSLRAPWFGVSCCPPNIARTLASLPALLATTDPDGLQLHQFAPARIETSLDAGTPIGLRLVTDYPRSGVVRVLVDRAALRPWTLTVRVPGWAKGAELAYRPVSGPVQVMTGTAPSISVTAAFAAGDELELRLPVEPVFVSPDPRIDAVRGCVVVQRGPVIYCAQSLAGSGPDLSRLAVHTATPPRDDGDRVVVAASFPGQAEDAWPYRTAAGRDGNVGVADLELIPYHDWGEAGPCTMRVWLPEA